MAFLIAAGIRYTIQGVQSGIQAHKDYQSDQAVQVSLDRYGQPKARSPVYGLVMKAEQKLNKGKPKGKGAVGNGYASTSIRDRREASESSADIGDGQVLHERDRAGAAPPSYEAAVGTSMREDIGEVGLANDEPRASLPRASATTHCRSAPTGSDNKQAPRDKVVRRSTGSSASSGSKSSSNSDSESHSESGNTILKTHESASTERCGCRARKAERRVERAERRLERKTCKLEKKGERASDHDIRKVRKAEWKLEEAQRKLGKIGL